MNISFIGLGKLGLCSAACFAFKGHKVIGVDSNDRFIRELKAGNCPIAETGLADLLAKARANMSFTPDYAEAVRGSDSTLIIVPTPSQKDGAFTNKYIETVLEQLGPALREKKSFHVVNIVSTVMPTSCETVFRPLLERLTGKICGRDFGLVYNPEFIALGSVIRDFLNPDMVLIGASDARSAEAVQTLYASMVDSAPTYSVMTLTNAEIAKLALNCFVTMKISFANELSSVCEGVPGADVDVITAAVGADSRVGSKYLKGGLGFGGPCFPRDNLAFQRFAELGNIPVHLSPGVIAVNNSVVGRIKKAVTEVMRPGSSVALLGLPYKSGTHIVEESQALMLADRLIEAGYSVRLHDPKALPEIAADYSGRAELCDDPYAAAKGAHGVILLTDWPQFCKLDWARIERNCAGERPVLFDSWRHLKNTVFTRFHYVAIGLGPREEAKA